MLRFGFTLLLFFLNSLWISFFLYLKIHPAKQQKEVRLQLQENLIDTDSINIEVNQEKISKIALKKENKDWKLVYPFSWPSNPIVVNNLLHTLLQLQPKFHFKLESLSDLNAYGLDSPQYILTCSSNEQMYTLKISDMTQTNSNVYIFEESTNEIFVTDSSFLSFLHLPIEQWCTPFLFSNKELQSISLETMTDKIYLGKEQGNWILKSPINAKVNKDRCDLLCQQILNLELKQFLTPEEGEHYIQKFTENDGLSTLTLTHEKGVETLTFIPLDKENFSYIGQLNHTGPLFTIHSNCFERLACAQVTLRERFLLNFDLKQLQRLSYTEADETFTLQKLNDAFWEISQYQNETFIQAGKAKSHVVNPWILSLKEMYVESFLNETVDFQNMKEVKIDLEFPQNKRTLTLHYNDEDCYAQLNDENTLFKLAFLNDAWVGKIFSDFEDKTLWSFSKQEKIKSVSISDGMHSQQLSLTPEELKIISHLEAKNWLKYNLTYPFFNPTHYTLTIETENEQQQTALYSLNFSERMGGSLQSGSFENKNFTLPQNWIDLLFKYTRKKLWEERSQFFVRP